MEKETRPWIALFSQTGSEILHLARELKRWPDVLVTNKRPTELRAINEDLIREFPGEVVELSNRPTHEELSEVFMQYDFPIITLHGWLRIMPAWFCDKYEIYNGHPGLITVYPELKGKDPQIRAYSLKHPTAGCVIHKVSPGVDEGPIKSWAEFDTYGLTLDRFFRTLSEVSLHLWKNLLNHIL